MDGLTAVPPLFDPAFAGARGKLAMGGPDAACLPLDGQFALHAALANLHKLYTARQALVIHAVASPYRERSHFDAQDILENGMGAAHAAQSGWLGRAFIELHNVKGLAVDRMCLWPYAAQQRSHPGRRAYCPSRTVTLLQRLDDLYRHDAVLAPALHEAQAASEIADDAMDGTMSGGKRGGKNFAAARESGRKFFGIA